MKNSSEDTALDAINVDLTAVLLKNYI